MSAALIAQLLAMFGPSAINLVTALIAKIEARGDVSAAEWAVLAADLKLTAADLMKAQLIAAGFDLNDPKAIALLNLTK